MPDRSLVDESTVAERQGLLHNLGLLTWMPVHSALVYAASRLLAENPKDRLALVITVIAASLLASSIASVTINRITCYSEDRSYDGLPIRTSDRVLATVAFCLFLMSLTLMLFHLTHP